MKIVLIILLLMALALGVLYWRFSQTLTYRWRGKIIRHRKDLDTKTSQLQAKIDSIDAAIEQQKIALFQRQLETMTPHALLQYPGIGPATVDRLITSGYRTIISMQGRNFESLDGIGPVKNREIQSALQRVVHDAESQFQAGTSPQGAEFRESQRSGPIARQREEQESFRQELTRLAHYLDLCRGHHDTARRVTFWKYLCGQAYTVPGEWYQIPLPEMPPITPKRIPPTPSAPVPPVPPTPPASMGKPTALPSSVPVVLPPQAIPHTTIPPKPTPRIQEDLFLGSSPAMADKPVSPAPTNVLPAQLVQLRALCAFGFLIAKADGRIAQAERKVIRDALADRYGHNPDLLRRLDVTLEQVEKESPIETDCLDELRTHFDRSTYPDLIELAHTIAQASSGVNSREEELLARLRREFNLPEKPAAAPTFTHAANTSTAPASGAAPAISPQEILEIDPTVPLSPDLIRRKYTLLSERLDPTRAATLGAEFAKLAEEKRLALKAAAEQLIAPFGEPLVVEKAPQPADLRHNPDLDDVFGL